MYYNESFGTSLKRGYLSIPTAIRTIITINVAVFFIQALGGQSFNNVLVKYLAFYPEPVTAIFQPWRFITYLFLHGGFFHLLFNMLWLWFMGRAVEETLGPRTLTVIFFGSGIGGGILDILFANLLGVNYVIGASGAVFGIMVSFAVLYPRMPIIIFLFPPIEARYVVAGLIAIDLLFLGGAGNTARIVHLGGAAVGYGLLKLHLGGTDLSLWVRKIERLWQTPAKSSPGSGRMGRGAGQAKSNKRSKRANMRSVTDANVVEEVDQSELDRILEKISKSGYDGLTDEEKRKLFDLSKRN